MVACFVCHYTRLGTLPVRVYVRARVRVMSAAPFRINSFLFPDSAVRRPSWAKRVHAEGRMARAREKARNNPPLAKIKQKRKVTER